MSSKHTWERQYPGDCECKHCSLHDAAPDLLKALNDLVDVVKANNVETSVIPAVRAIRKAEGGE